MLLSEFLDRHYRISVVIRPSTVLAYRICIDSLSRFAGHSVRCDELTIDLLNRWVHHEIDRGLSLHTVKSRRIHITVLWRAAATAGQAQLYHPPVIVRPPKKVIQAIGEDVILDLIRRAMRMSGRLIGTEIPNARYWPAFIALGYETALRTSDLLQLRYCRTGQWIVTQIKTSRPVTVAVSSGTLELAAVLAEVSPKLLSVTRRREWFARQLGHVTERFGHRLTPQRLRQSFASEAERLKPGSAWVLLGHSSPATCQTWYIDSAHAYRDLPRPRIRWDAK